jgi:anthranilate phosphoribosyltransferase
VITEKVMTKPIQGDQQPEALAAFATTARNKGEKPPELGVTATAETAPKSGDLAAEEEDAADILGGNATGDKAKVDAAIAHRVKTDKRAG